MATVWPKSRQNRPSLVLRAARWFHSAPLPVKTNASPALLLPPQSICEAAMTAVEPCRSMASPKVPPSLVSSQASLARCVHLDPLRVYTYTTPAKIESPTVASGAPTNNVSPLIATDSPKPR